MADDQSHEDQTERTMISRHRIIAAPRPTIGHFLTFTDRAEFRRVSIGECGVTIGRVPPCDVVIPSPEISRRHCRIELDGDWAVLTDLGSTNGTHHGAERVEQPTRLRNGSQISLGSFTLRYERRNQQEVAEEADLNAELRRAADYVRAILPQPITEGPVQVEWCFVPCSQLAGDAFGYQYLDDTCFTGFVIDVSGHGIGSAMHAANVANTLRRRALPGVDFREPAQVAAGLNTMFPMEEHNFLLLTLWYFAYDTTTRQLRYCAAGHHPSLLTTPAQPEPTQLWAGSSPTIGMMPTGTWLVGEATIPPGSRMYLFSDGAFEIFTRDGGQWKIEDLQRVIREAASGVGAPELIYQAVRAVVADGPLEDDFSVLAVEFK